MGRIRSRARSKPSQSARVEGDKSGASGPQGRHLGLYVFEIREGRVTTRDSHESTTIHADRTLPGPWPHHDRCAAAKDPGHDRGPVATGRPLLRSSRLRSDVAGLLCPVETSPYLRMAPNEQVASPDSETSSGRAGTRCSGSGRGPRKPAAG